jgi:hypothetical protein
MIELDEEQSKYLDIEKIQCPCGSPINIWAEIVDKKNKDHVVQWVVKCSKECGRTGMIWKNQFLYNWD